MKLAQILTLLQSEPLLCDNSYRAALLELFNQHAHLSRDEFAVARTGKNKSGEAIECDEAEVQDGVCIIPVGGPMGIGLGEFEKGAGAVDMDDIGADLDEAEASNDVENIILNFDSPGGTVQGTFELCDKIMAVHKPIYSFSRGLMCSAAYAAASATDGIFSTKSATVGNIGVYTTYLDLSQAASKQGIAVKVFSSGPIKGAGVPGTALTLEQQNFIQQRVMGMARMFYEHVKERRPGIKDEDFGGQYFSGDEAGTRGFVDGLVSDLGELVSQLRSS
jgi:signal peptide peptidase SppA